MADLGPLSAMATDEDEQKAELGGSDNSGDYGAGALSTANYAGVPGAAEAFQAMAKSNQEARAALQRARDSIAARKWNRTQALLAMSAAFGQPTRTGSFGESLSNVANAVRGPLAERDTLEQDKQKELLGIDTQIAGLDQSTAKAQLDLAGLRAKLNSDQMKAPNELVLATDAEGKPVLDEKGNRVYKWASHLDARGQPGYTPGGTQVSIDQRAEGAAEKEMQVALAKRYNSLQDSAVFETPEQQAKLDRMEGLMTDIQGGKATPLLADLASFGESFGIKLDPKLGAKQAAESLAREFALTLRNPSEGGGMPGNLSNSDREYLKSMVPGLSQTAEGRKLMFETARKLLGRKQDLARVAREYKRTHGGKLDDGLYDTLQDYANQNPLFAKPAEIAPPGPAAAAAAGAPPVTASQHAPPPLLARPGTAAEAPQEEETQNPDDTAPAGENFAPRAVEAYVVSHPETAEQFLRTWHYLPKEVKFPRVVPRR